ncbi:hypothetical protein O6H91_01G004000 [Diphasiastrum complanatum]|uniref:Uncharacterized protein n=1 Tax=Diphasiastrum complanatum TaxID=34168 RepID=A0ACC2EMN5_DIPCM|nr:hypothetical protein O6H91_01G004000 [Diphasiastrum complanatum]
MANQSIVQKLKKAWASEVQDEEKLAVHLRLVRAAALFAGAIFFMRNFGDSMAI